MTLTLTCPGNMTVAIAYTVAGNTIQLQSDPTSTDQEIHTITKQP